MGKAVNADVLDGALGVIRANATRMVATAVQPATFAAASAGKLAEAVMAPADFTYAAGDTSGRKLAVAAKADLAVAAAGTATHVALLDPATSRLLYVTTCAAQVLSLGGTVSFAGWDIEIGDPV
jgi:hypothetical protein